MRLACAVRAAPFRGTVTRKSDSYDVRYDNGSASWLGIRKGNTLSIAYVCSDGGWGLQVFTIEKGKDGPRLTAEYKTYPDGRDFIRMDGKPLMSEPAAAA